MSFFNCGNNKIKNIPIEICNLTQLRDFSCCHNFIKEIPKEIGNLTELEQFSCNSNYIQNIPIEIGNCINLKSFYCHNNQITTIPKEIGNLVHLDRFFCDKNQISIIPKEIGNLLHLEYFICSDNQIETIPIEIMNCINLHYFRYSNNEIEYIQPQILRWLNRFRHGQQLYNDKQSVHNHSIQKGVQKSIEYIMSIKPTIQMKQLKELIINNQYLKERVKRILFEYMDSKEIHSILHITFEELLLSVYDFIEKNENKKELFEIMNVEMLEANCKCFTGRISRLINVLNGYDDNIEIYIADNEQISNIISLIKNNLGDDYDENEFKKLIREELSTRNYSEDVINEWLDNI